LSLSEEEADYAVECLLTLSSLIVDLIAELLHVGHQMKGQKLRKK
jgi:hypothetical protein